MRLQFAGILSGVGLAVIFWLLPYRYPNMPDAVINSGLGLGGFLFLVSIIMLFWPKKNIPKQPVSSHDDSVAAMKQTGSGIQSGRDTIIDQSIKNIFPSISSATPKFKSRSQQEEEDREEMYQYRRVKARETLESISEELYGNPNHADRLKKINAIVSA